MAKQKAPSAQNFNEVDAKTMTRINRVLDEATRHRYGASEIFGMHNYVFKRNDKVQLCASCLRNRVRELKTWYDAGKSKAPVVEDVLTTPVTPPAETGEAPVNNEAPTQPAAEPTKVETPENATEPVKETSGAENEPKGVRYEVEGAQPIDFIAGSADPLKGTVLFADGSNVKAGTYKAGDATIKVQVGGKATVVVEDLT